MTAPTMTRTVHLISTLSGIIDLEVVLTDGDGDTATDTIDLGSLIKFEDDGPAVISKTDINYANANNPLPGGTGIFDYDIGSDYRTTYSQSNSDFSTINLTGTVGGVAITSSTVTWVSESATQAQLTASICAQSSGSGTVQAEGTLIFDKVAGTYMVSLDEPIQSVTIATTSDPSTLFQGYNESNNVQDNSGPAQVSVARLAPNFFVHLREIKKLAAAAR